MKGSSIERSVRLRCGPARWCRVPTATPTAVNHADEADLGSQHEIVLSRRREEHRDQENRHREPERRRGSRRHTRKCRHLSQIERQPDEHQTGEAAAPPATVLANSAHSATS